MRSMPDPSQPQGWRHKRFKFYALYSWGGPFLISLVTILMQALPEHVTEGSVTPKVGDTRCFLGDRWAMIFYLNIIILPVGLINILFFISSMYNLLCGLWSNRSGDPVMKAQQKSMYKTVIKMFFAMGITWFAEAISHVLEWAYKPQDVKYIVLFFKIINSLQGLILFCVIVFDSAMIDKIKHVVCGIEPPRPNKANISSAVYHTTPDRARAKDSITSWKSLSIASTWLKGKSQQPNAGETVELK